MESLILKDFRCFGGTHEVPLRPLTILLGENSSGKTNFLAAARIVEQLLTEFAISPDFNAEPFVLGAFEELVHRNGSKFSRNKNFRLGATSTFSRERRPNEIRFAAEFVKFDARPIIKAAEFSSQNHALEFDFFNESSPMLIRTPSLPEGIFPLDNHDWKEKITSKGPPYEESWLLLPLLIHEFRDLFKKGRELSLEESQFISTIARRLFMSSNRPPYAAAPIRAQPKRTYEPLSDLPRPQGDHVPILIAQIYGDKQWEELRNPIERFARASGLFEELIVKKLGKSESSPFQIHVKLGGTSRNLIDVGYGVSQILPLLVDLLRENRPRMYLIQQPEVHLHPRAQAELGTLFGTIAKSHKKQLLIETHSDYIVDRVRMDVREKKIKTEDVIILYFERKRANVKIHPIEIDEHGNLIDPPPSYRSFFLEEEARFLGVADVHHH